MTAAALDLLQCGEIEVEGRMPWSSNATLLVTVTQGDAACRGIYKPRRGERPLWDFPPGLDKREVAAYRLSELLGWDLVPPTVLRDGPHGVGSVQLFIDADFEEHYLTLYEAGRHHDAMRRMCAFDLLANNTDRKSGHCLVSDDDRLFGIDHGLCFHEDFKIRTVIWEFSGEEIAAPLLADVRRLLDTDLGPALGELLSVTELMALRQRAEGLLSAGVYPHDRSQSRYPWPLV